MSPKTSSLAFDEMGDDNVDLANGLEPKLNLLLKSTTRSSFLHNHAAADEGVAYVEGRITVSF